MFHLVLIHHCAAVNVVKTAGLVSNDIASDAVSGNELGGGPDSARMCPWKLIDGLEIFVVVPDFRIVYS
jgi:hypothetical protein